MMTHPPEWARPAYELVTRTLGLSEQMAHFYHLIDKSRANVLRRIAAERRVLARHFPMSNGSCDLCWHLGMDVIDSTAWPCDEIRDLADRNGILEELMKELI